MALSPEEILAAKKLHDSVTQFEQERQTYRPSWYALPVLLLLISLEAANERTLPFILVAWSLVLLAALLQPLRSARRRDRNRRERALLEVLEREHAEQLPWVVVEKRVTDAKAYENQLGVEPAVP